MLLSVWVNMQHALHLMALAALAQAHAWWFHQVRWLTTFLRTHGLAKPDWPALHNQYQSLMT